LRELQALISTGFSASLRTTLQWLRSRLIGCGWNMLLVGVVITILYWITLFVLICIDEPNDIQHAITLWYY